MAACDAIDCFLSRAFQDPLHPAVISSSGFVSYGELENRVRRLATGLAAVPGPRVLIALPQSADAYAAMLATSLVGGYYIPLNLSAPLDKLSHIIRLSEPDIVVVDTTELSPQQEMAIRTAASTATIFDVSSASELSLFEGRGRRHEIAYVIFTSGSTGVPKGVIIPRAGLNHYVAWAIENLAIGPADRVTQYPNIGFDLSVIEIYSALCSGAALCPIVSRGDRLMPARFVERHGITVWVSVPSVISLVANARQMHSALFGSVRLFFFCGEPLLTEHVAAVFAACPQAIVINAYGPTEATVSVTSHTLTTDNYSEACSSSVSLGEPIPDMGLYLIGSDNENEGEIVIAGIQLALGYWRDPERSSQAFRKFDSPEGTLLGYFTGDWAERRGGHLFFRERLDFQTKIHGFRIELDEVAAAIRACGWPVVCALKHGETLVAAIESQNGVHFDERSLRAALAKILDDYAMPSEILVVAHMPRNANDKIDRRAVAALFDAPILYGSTPVIPSPD